MTITPAILTLLFAASRSCVFLRFNDLYFFTLPCTGKMNIKTPEIAIKKPDK